MRLGAADLAVMCKKGMKEHHCVSRYGEHFIILENDKGVYLCPVCGSAEFDEPPYDENGNPSFKMCSCGFEYGFADSNMASKKALEAIAPNWDRWRLKVIDRNKHTKQDLERLENNLKQIGYRLAFDLMPVRINDNT